MKATRWWPVLMVMACLPKRELPRFEAATPLPWVNPARCLSSCAHRDERALVEIDASGALVADGGFRLRAEAQPALAAMLEGAAESSVAVTVASAYRTYEEQAALWDQLSVTEPGRPARPGHSEHEAGLAVDLGFSSDGAAWVAANAVRFGFVLSYPQGAQRETGFNYEPWHFRFVGQTIAERLAARGDLPLEALFSETPELGVSGDCSDCPQDSSRSDCSAVTPAGACEGQVLRWCFSGAEAAVDCAASGLRCAADGGAECVEP